MKSTQLNRAMMLLLVSALLLALTPATAMKINKDEAKPAQKLTQQKIALKTMAQMWDNTTADDIQMKIMMADELISSCLDGSSNNASLNVSKNASEYANSTKKKDTESTKTNKSEMCKTQKTKLKEVHELLKTELKSYLKSIEEASDTFSQDKISKNGLTSAQLNPFTKASKMVQDLQALEKRYLNNIPEEPVFDKLSEQMSQILTWYEKYEKESNPAPQDD